MVSFTGDVIKPIVVISLVGEVRHSMVGFIMRDQISIDDEENEHMPV